MNRVLSSIRIPSRDEDPSSRLQQLVRQRRRIARQHVHLDAWLSPRRWNAATGIAFLAEIPACVANPGLDAERAARAIRVLGFFVLGATRDETQGCAHGPRRWSH
ncbi:hypothetical protein ACPOLB_27045 [Rubrivivax sp. RP6-9]|uniref:hypothetical protein n=1 Tax=Rubrivivax sp. RP6-9 TaxID=3415750 RepID=UPI003CC63914